MEAICSSYLLFTTTLIHALEPTPFRLSATSPTQTTNSSPISFTQESQFSGASSRSSFFLFKVNRLDSHRVREVPVASLNFYKLMRLFLLTLLLAFPISGEEGQHLSGSGRNESLDRLTFSSTQKWDRNLLKYTQQPPLLLPQNWLQLIALPHPPANSSERTREELRVLKSLAPKRAKSNAQIQAEVLLTNFPFDKHTYTSLTESTKRPATAKLVKATFEDTAIATFVFKKQFNRVRPSLLAEKLKAPIGTALPNPEHPAYPSGHAATAWSISYLLQELDPANAENYRKSAASIAHHREIAGLHYPSDSEAGRLLARQLLDLLLANPHFQRQLTEAKKEWSNG